MTNSKNNSDLRATLRAIRSDMLADAKALDGRDFNGATAGETFGGLMGTIIRLAEIVESLLPVDETHFAVSPSRCSCGWEVDGFTAPELAEWKLNMHVADYEVSA